MKLENVAINDNSMTRIVAAMKTDHIIGFASKEISYLSFAFVAPLGTYDCGDSRRVGRHDVPRAGLVEWR